MAACRRGVLRRVGPKHIRVCLLLVGLSILCPSPEPSISHTLPLGDGGRGWGRNVGTIQNRRLPWVTYGAAAPVRKKLGFPSDDETDSDSGSDSESDSESDSDSESESGGGAGSGVKGGEGVADSLLDYLSGLGSGGGLTGGAPGATGGGSVTRVKTPEQLIKDGCRGDALPKKIELAIVLDNSNSFDKWLRLTPQFLPQYVDLLAEWQPDLKVALSRFCDRPDFERDMKAHPDKNFNERNFASKLDRCFYPLLPLTPDRTAVRQAFNKQMRTCYGGELEEDQLTAISWVAKKWAGFSASHLEGRTRMILLVTDDYTKHGKDDLNFDGDEPPCQDHKAFTPISQAGRILREAQIFPLVYLAMTQNTRTGTTTRHSADTLRRWHRLFRRMGYKKGQYLIKTFKKDATPAKQIYALLQATIEQACESLVQPVLEAPPATGGAFEEEIDDIDIEADPAWVADVGGDPYDVSGGDSGEDLGGDSGGNPGDPDGPPGIPPGGPAGNPPASAGKIGDGVELGPGDTTTEPEGLSARGRAARKRLRYGVVGAVVGAAVVVAAVATAYFQKASDASAPAISYEFEGGENLDVDEEEANEQHIVFTGEDAA